MGGKTKQSQRTKNNARPSSSGRSAELLTGVAVESGLLSLPRPALFPSLAAPALDPLLTPELQLCLKKLNKKDPITKTKALQELSELVNNSKVDDVVAALPSWSHFYKILTADPDRKVRECTQACHGVMVSVCGRRAAPQLKQLAPAWLQAQYDEHAPACAHAQNSLAKTFPDNKLPEVLSFCKEEIITHLLNILSGNGETAHIRKLESEEARAAAASRMLSSGLHGLQFLVQQLPDSQSPWLWEQLQPLLQASAFWKKATHSEPRIRAAWFGAVGSIIARFKAEFGPLYGGRALRAAVGPRESTPLVAAALWGCLLLFMHNVPEWHQYLEKKELLSKRILDVLESGGWGDARHLSAVLLPLLANLPDEMLTKQFHVSFFDALFSGLDQKSILNSKSERQSWITSLEECLRFLSTTPHEFVVEVVTGVHRSWLERVLRGPAAGPTGTHLVKVSAASMAKLIKYWLKQAALPGGERYDQLIRNCWQNVGSTLAAQVESMSLDHTDIQKQIDSHIILLQTLKTSFTQELKKQRSIKFEIDATTEEKESVSSEAQNIDPTIAERYNHNLEELIQSLCENYFDFASKKEIAQPVLSPLITLLSERDNKAAFLGIARQFSCDSVYQLYDNVFRRWLAGDTMRCRAVLDIVFMMMKHLTEQEQDAMFDSFKQFPPSVVEWCISLSLSHPHVRRTAVRRWLRGAVAAGAVGALCRRVLERDSNQDRSLLLMCLDSDQKGESMVCPIAVQDALLQVSASLRDAQAQGAALEARVRLAAQLACSHAPHIYLLSALLTLTATIQRGDPILSVETWCEARDAWQEGCAALESGPRELFLLEAVATIHGLLNLSSNLTKYSTKSKEQSKDPPTPDKPSDKDAVDLPRIEHVTSLCPALACGPAAAARMLTATLFDVRETPPLAVEAYATRHYILTGSLVCPFVDNEVMEAIVDDKLTELAREDLISHINTVVFRTACLRAMLLHRPDAELDTHCCDALLQEDYFRLEFVKCVHDYTVLCALYEGYAFWPHYKILEKSKNRLGILLEDIVKETSKENRTHITNSLIELATSKGYFWIYAAKYYTSKVDEINVENDNKSSPTDAVSQSDETSQDIRKTIEVVLDKSKSSENKGAEEFKASENKAAHECKASENKAAEEFKASENKAAEEFKASENKAAEECKASENKGAEEFKASENKAAEECKASENKGAEECKACENKGAEEFKASENKAAEEFKASDNKDAEELQASNNKAAEECPKLSVEGAMAAYLQDNNRGPAMIYLLNYLQVRCGASLDTQYRLAAASMHCAHAHEPEVAAAILRDVTQAEPDVFVNAYYAHNHTMLYEMDVSSSAWSLVASNAAICLYLAACVDTGGWAQAAHVWDFTNIALCSLLTSANLSKDHWGCTKVSILTRSALQLFARVRPFVGCVRARCERDQPSAHVAALPTEWADIYAPDLNHNLFQIVLHVLESSTELKLVNSNHVSVLDALIHALPHMDWEALTVADKEGSLTAARLVAAGGAALAGVAHPALKHLAYCLVHQMLKPLVLRDAEALVECNVEGEGEGGVLALSLRAHQTELDQVQGTVEALLANYEVCEELCRLEPMSDAYSLMLGYLLLVDVVNTQCMLACGELTHHYIQIYRESQYQEALLCACLRLLPEDVMCGARARGPPPAACTARAVDFSTRPPVDVYKWSGSGLLSRLACRGLWWAARGPGVAAARGWRGVAHHAHAQLLDNIVARYVTPCVVKEEFSRLQQHSGEVEDAEISVNWSAYEVICELTVDENPIGLTIALSRSHPLVLPKLTAHHAATGNINWIPVYLGYQNGSILNALKMWSSNVNSKMEKAPQCYICYCRLHHKTGRLPNVYCRTCHNKFHSGCLHKWFVSSGKTTCPLCRGAF